MISIVLPVFNEGKAGLLERILAALARTADAQVIVVDGGSRDGTVPAVRAHPFALIEMPGSTRAARLNRGIAESAGEVVFLHHPRTLVAPEAFAAVAEYAAGRRRFWGGLTQRFDEAHPLLAFTSWYSNNVRVDRRGIVYLDHCMFFDGRFRDEGLAVPDVPIFEDTELSLILRGHGMPARLPAAAVTSAIRYAANGVFRQMLLNQALKAGRGLGVSPDALNRWYERGIGLNGPDGAG